MKVEVTMEVLVRGGGAVGVGVGDVVEGGGDEWGGDRTEGRGRGD